MPCAWLWVSHHGRNLLAARAKWGSTSVYVRFYCRTPQHPCNCRLTNFLSSTPSSLRASFGRSSLLSQSSPDPLAAVRASGTAMGRANSQPPSPQLADMSRTLAPGADASAPVGRAGVTRTLAPNGQPRKVPTALLAPGSAPAKPARLDSGGGSMEGGWKIGANNQTPAATTYGSAFGRLSSGTRQTRN